MSYQDCRVRSPDVKRNLGRLWRWCAGATELVNQPSTGIELAEIGFDLEGRRRARGASNRSNSHHVNAVHGIRCQARRLPPPGDQVASVENLEGNEGNRWLALLGSDKIRPILKGRAAKSSCRYTARDCTDTGLQEVDAARGIGEVWGQNLIGEVNGEGADELNETIDEVLGIAVTQTGRNGFGQGHARSQRDGSEESGEAHFGY